MPINIPGFQNQLLSYFNEDPDGKTIQGTAAEIVDAYVSNFVEAGTDPVSLNSLVVIPPKQQALQLAFENMFTVAVETGTPANLGLVAPSLIAFWAGGLLSTSGLVPGTVGTVSAVVTVPGVATPIPFPPAGPDPTPFITTLQTFFQTHILTVNFLITGLVPVPPPGAPVPTPFPSIGYI